VQFPDFWNYECREKLHRKRGVPGEKIKSKGAWQEEPTGHGWWRASKHLSHLPTACNLTPVDANHQPHASKRLSMQPAFSPSD